MYTYGSILKCFPFTFPIYSGILILQWNPNFYPRWNSCDCYPGLFAEIGKNYTLDEKLTCAKLPAAQKNKEGRVNEHVGGEWKTTSHRQEITRRKPTKDREALRKNPLERTSVGCQSLDSMNKYVCSMSELRLIKEWRGKTNPKENRGAQGGPWLKV